MRTYAVLLLCVATALAVPQFNVITPKDLLRREGSRIISGKPAALGQFPWQAALDIRSGIRNWSCGGSLIDKQWILTAAHCADGALFFIIKLGGVKLSGNEPSRIEVVATKSYVHENYNSTLGNNDIALVKLRRPVDLNDNIQTIRLPSRGNRVGSNVSVTVSGYGITSESGSGTDNDVLNFVGIDTISNDDCREIYGEAIIIDSTLCCKGHPEHSTCDGDSGGPLITLDGDQATQVGVVSFVHPAGCASGNPSGYVRTESYLDWIADKTGLEL